MKQDTEMALRDKGSETTDKGYKRAREILAAARAILAEDGYAGLSMRTLATGLGISLSTVQHYYPSKDALLEALLVAMQQDYQAALERVLSEGSQATRQQQFEAFVDYLLDDVADRESSGVLRELWALAHRNEFAAEIVDRILTKSRKVVRNLIRQMSPALSKEAGELRGALVIALLQGLTLYLASSRPQHEELRRLKASARATIVQLALGKELA